MSPHVAFRDKKLESSFEALQQGRFEDRKLYCFIQRAIADLKTNPGCGVKIPRRLWPKEYVLNFSINNLRKYDLPNGWRLVYTITGDGVRIVSIILEWFDHKGYERRFRY